MNQGERRDNMKYVQMMGVNQIVWDRECIPEPQGEAKRLQLAAQASALQRGTATQEDSGELLIYKGGKGCSFVCF